MYGFQEKAVNYAIYIRKSTDEKGKQQMSLEDQLFYCEQLAKKEGLNVIEKIEESKSAKKPRVRPKFEALLKKIEKGDIDGIIAWHPDRLARNMGDGGRIIELVDEDILVDLRFCTQQFSKDANGKMLLGLAFVLSKQYSDKLSDDVSRGFRRRHQKGLALGRRKYGYDIKDGKYVKGKDWEIFNTAWQMKIQGEKNMDILKMFEEAEYTYAPMSGKKQSQKQVMTTQKLSKMFRNPFYYGSLVMNGEEVFLPDRYDFQPMITELDFFQINEKMENEKHNKGSKKFKPLFGKVVDVNYPNIEYKPGTGKGKGGTKYLYYTVNTKHKERVPSEYRANLKGVRAKEIVDAFDYLLQNIEENYCKQDYEAYLEKAREYFDMGSEERKLRIRRIEKQNRDLEEEYKDITLGLIKGRKASKQKEIGEKRCKEIEKLIKGNNQILDGLKKEESNILPSFKEFLNTMKSLISSYSTMSGQRKLEIAEIMILNTFVYQGKVHHIELNEPFNELLNFKNPIWLG